MIGALWSYHKLWFIRVVVGNNCCTIYSKWLPPTLRWCRQRELFVQVFFPLVWFPNCEGGQYRREGLPVHRRSGQRILCVRPFPTRNGCKWPYRHHTQWSSGKPTVGSVDTTSRASSNSTRCVLIYLIKTPERYFKDLILCHCFQNFSK